SWPLHGLGTGNRVETPFFPLAFVKSNAEVRVALGLLIEGQVSLRQRQQVFERVGHISWDTVKPKSSRYREIVQGMDQFPEFSVWAAMPLRQIRPRRNGVKETWRS